MTVAFIGYVSGLDVGRNALVVLLAVVALVFLSGNYALLFQFAFQKKRGSFVPPVGGVAGLLAMLLVPSLRRCGLFLLPLVLDPGTWALVCGLPILVADFKRRDLNLTKTLFLQSVDDCVFAEPRRCVVLRKLRSGKRRGVLEVELDPPLDGRFHGLLRPGISKVALASRHSPDGFATDDAFPPSVYVCRMLAEPDWLGRIDPSTLQPLSWAEVFKTLDAARKRMDPIVLSFPTVRYPSWKFSMKEKTGLSWRLLVFGFKKGFLSFDQLASYADDPENGLPDDTRKDLFRQIISLCSVTDFQHCCAFADTLVRYDDFRKTVPSESELSACWMFVIFDWAHGLDFPAWHRLALAACISARGWLLARKECGG